MLNFFTAIKDRIQGRASKGQSRSPEWEEARNEHIRTHPVCAVCGSTKGCEVHHIVPFNIAPDLELDPNNLMTLCRNKKYGINCHLLVGHLGNFRKTNPNCVIDAMTWKYKLIGSK